ncbi:MAG: DNA repair protein RecN [Proteobacteria bacterium]|nr:DNA repair protein RecN [Candidatus Enterousia scatequi]
MLTNLYIANIVLIEKLNLEFGPGLNVLTGETGAGKSILMDALALALGARSDVGLVRSGCDCATVVAEFDSFSPNIARILSDNGIDAGDTITLKRTLSSDGKSRAWINDMPVSIKVLKEVGDNLVEIHGQFANHALLDASSHIDALDAFASGVSPEFKDVLSATGLSYQKLHSLETKERNLRELLEKSEIEREFLEHNVTELRALNVQVGEEDELATMRAALMNAEKNAAIIADASSALNPSGNSLESQICSVAHILERINYDNKNPYSDQIDKLYDCAQTIAEISQQVTNTSTDVGSIDEIEERLFAIRGLARKHRVSANDLPKKLQEMESELNAIDNSDAELNKIAKELAVAQSEFQQNAHKLSQLRARAADELRIKILDELPDLKLGSADFRADISPTTASNTGQDCVQFMIKTNPGSPFAPLNKCASGGELSRLMLAMRVVLNKLDNCVFVFDEIDTGISGATAAAVGARLNRLARAHQSLVITHSAQVAGYADKHFKIAKHSETNKTVTTVDEISGDDCINEIARIISGNEITPESIATAKTLLKN